MIFVLSIFTIVIVFGIIVAFLGGMNSYTMSASERQKEISLLKLIEEFPKKELEYSIDLVATSGHEYTGKGEHLYYSEIIKNPSEIKLFINVDAVGHWIISDKLAFYNFSDDQKINIGCFESMCNPIAQAYVMNEEKTEFNIVMGLCVGHDSLFLKYADAPCTVLAAKDRLLGHNPLAAVYTIDTYYRSLLAE